MSLARIYPFVPAETDLQANNGRSSSKKREWFRSPKTASSRSSTCVRFANPLCNINLRPAARLTTESRVRHGSSSVVIALSICCGSHPSTCGRASADHYPACARGRPLESSGVNVTIRPALRVRSNVTARPNIRNCGAIRRSSAEAMAGVLGQPGVVRVQ
jgi:hypothetical protein